MSFRSILIEEHCKLSCALNYLVCRRGNDEKKVLLDEINIVVIDTPQVSITTGLLSMLSKKKIKVLLCDEKHNPEAELVPYINNYYSYRKIKEQILFTSYDNGKIWSEIIKNKILNQASNLKYMNLLDEYNLLMSYIEEIKDGDITNREGHSAKVYFNALFGKDFSRSDGSNINCFLNYGYALIASTISRELKGLGYLTELGIHHIGESNPFNLTYDLIEPLRALVDYYVIAEKVNNDNYKLEYLNMLSIQVKYKDQSLFLINAIHLYVIDIINNIKSKDANINFIKYEL